MKIKLLEAVMIAGIAFKEGEVVDVSDADAKYLLARGKAEKSGKESKKTSVKKVAVVVAKPCLVDGVHREAGEKVRLAEDGLSYLISRGFVVAADSEEAKAIVKEAKAQA